MFWSLILLCVLYFNRAKINDVFNTITQVLVVLVGNVPRFRRTFIVLVKDSFVAGQTFLFTSMFILSRPRALLFGKLLLFSVISSCFRLTPLLFLLRVRLISCLLCLVSPVARAIFAFTFLSECLYKIYTQIDN